MPLKHSGSKKAFSKNVEIEMAHGKPQKTALAIAYSVKRKAGKKKASGGTVASGAKDMNYVDGGKVDKLRQGGMVNADDEGSNDRAELADNRGDKAPSQDSWTDRPDIKQSIKGMKTTRIKHPSMAQSPVFKVKMRDEEDDLEQSAKPASPDEQPPRDDDEMGADRQGSQVRDMQDEHSTGRKPYAKGGSIIGEMRSKGTYGDSTDQKGVHNQSRHSEKHGTSVAGQALRNDRTALARMAHQDKLEESRSMPNPKLKGLAKGGKIEHNKSDQRYFLDRAAEHSHPEIKQTYKDIARSRAAQHLEGERMVPPPKLKGLAKGGEVESSDYDHPLDGRYEDDLLDLNPSHDEGLSMADSDDEEGQDRQGPKVSDMEREHSNGRMPYARGGEVSPDDEIDMDHEDSIAAAIMAKRGRMHADIDSGAYDMDHAVRMAEGGEINGMDSIYAHPDEDQADLSRNAEEDANMEDQSSFDALRKENYSESEGLDQLDNPKDSGQHSHEIDKDDHDMVDKIRKQMKSKRQFKAR